MDISPQVDDHDHPTQVNDNVRTKKGSIGKHQLVEQFFKRLNTGGFSCKLCEGSDQEQKV